MSTETAATTAEDIEEGSRSKPKTDNAIDAEIIEVMPNEEEDDGEHIPQVQPKRSFSRFCRHLFYEKLCPVNIDLKAYFPLLLILLSEGITSSSVSSYMGYLVVDVGAASDTDDAGTWSGILMSSFFVCQFISSFAMGYFSDNFGRRPTLLICVFGSFVTQLLFGFSTNIWMAIILRGANGLLNGNVSVAKVCLSELTDKTNRVKAFSHVGLMVGVGRIVGSTLGGYTARPAVEYSDTFSSDGFFGKYPYALSNICVSSTILFTFIIAVFYVKETSKILDAKRAERARKRMLKEQQKRMKKSGQKSSSSNTTRDEEEGIGMDDLNGSDKHEPNTDGEEHTHSLLKNNKTTTSNNKKKIKSVEVHIDHTDDVFRHVHNYEDDEDEEGHHHNDDDIITPENDEHDHEHDEEDSTDEKEAKKEKKGMDWFIGKVKRNKYTSLVIFMYALGSFVQMTTFSQISTWTVASIKSGGLEFSPRDVGLTTAIGGVATVFSLTFVSGSVIKYLSIIVTTRLSGLILVPVLACMPLGNNIARRSSNAAVWGLEGVLVFLWQGTVQILFNTVNVLIPNSVPNEKLAMAQASAQAAGAVAKAIGPTVIGILLEWSLAPERKFPFNYFFTFFILAFVCLVYFILSFFVPKSMNYPYGVYEEVLREEKEEKERKEREKRERKKEKKERK